MEPLAGRIYFGVIAIVREVEVAPTVLLPELSVTLTVVGIKFESVPF